MSVVRMPLRNRIENAIHMADDENTVAEHWTEGHDPKAALAAIRAVRVRLAILKSLVKELPRT